MAVVQLDYYSNIDTSIEDLQNTVDGNFIGHHRVTLTNYNNTSAPAIAAGSIVENNGSLFKFETETAISGSATTSNDNYIYLVPSGDPSLGTATVTPTWTTTAPTWSDSKQGYYGTSGSANYRYLYFIIPVSSGGLYTKKVLTYEDKLVLNILYASTISAIGGAITVTTATIGTANITDLRLTNPIPPPYKAYDTLHGSIQERNIFIFLDGWSLSVNDVIPVFGSIYTTGTIILSYAEKTSSTNIRLYGTFSGIDGVTYHDITNASTTSRNVSISI